MTALPSDLNTTSRSSFPSFDAASTVQNRLVFSATDASHGTEPWVTDGTAAGTTLLADIAPGTANASISKLSPLFNGFSFFIAEGRPDYSFPQNMSDAVDPTADPGVGSTPSGPLGIELWKTDGTPAGTSRVAILQPDSPTDYSDVAKESGQFVATAGSLYFVSRGTVWTTDGTEEGTATVDGVGGVTARLFVLNSTLFALSYDGSAITLSIRNDNGSFEVVKDQISGVLAGQPTPFGSAAWLFTTRSAAYDQGSLWKTDGTDVGTVEITSNFSPSSDGRGLAVLGNAVYFAGKDDETGVELWRSDGTPTGTQRLKDLNPGSSTAYSDSSYPNSSYPSELTAFGGKLFFRATTQAGGYELWSSDGTAGNTKQVVDLAPGSTKYTYEDYFTGLPVTVTEPNSSYPNGFTVVGGKLYFQTTTSKLYTTDGTAANTKVVKDLSGADTGSGGFGAMASLAGNLFLSAATASAGQELWISDGTANGTKLFKDINPGTEDGISAGSMSYVAGAALNGVFLFAGNNGKTGTELYKRDASGAVSLVKDLHPGYPGQGSQLDEFTTIGNYTYFSVGGTDPVNYTPLREIWRTDGTAAKTTRVGTLTSSDQTPFGFVSFGGSVFVAADIQPVDEFSPPGRGIYRINPSTGAATLVAGSDGLNAESFTVSGGKLYFVNTNFSSPVGAIYSMATAASTPTTAAFDDGSLFGTPEGLAAVGNRLFFTAQANDDQVYKLYVTDGTLEGTAVVVDNQGSSFNALPNLVAAGDGVYFTGSAADSGFELWKATVANGAVTASLVKDITPGTDGTVISGLVARGNGANFLVEDPTTGGRTLWETNGTPQGTNPVWFPAGNPPQILQLSAPVGNTMFVAARDDLRGTELWKLDLAASVKPAAPKLDAADDTGSSDSDNYTNKAVVTLVGSAAAPNGTVTLYKGATKVGSSVSVDDNGAWSMPGVALAAGANAFTIKVTEPLGGVSLASDPLTITRDSVAPVNVPAPVLLAEDNTGASNSDFITSNTRPRYKGTTEPGAKVDLFVNDVANASGFADSKGGYLLKLSDTLVDGTYTVTVKVTDKAGNTSDSSKAAPLTIDNSSPSLTGVAAPTAKSYKAGDVISIPVSFSAPVSVTGVPSITIKVGTATRTAAFAGGSGTKTLSFGYKVAAGDVDVDGIEITGGSVSLPAAAFIKSTAKNTTVSPLTFTAPDTTAVFVDTVAPTAPTLQPLDAALTNKSTVTLRGTAPASESGGTAAVYRAGVPVAGATTTLDGTGNWTITNVPLVDKANLFTIKLWDKAGNASPASNARTVTLDAVPPPKPAKPTLAAGDMTNAAAAATSKRRPSVTGSVEAGARVDVYVNGTLNVQLPAADGKTGKFSQQLAGELPDGDYQITVKAVDRAGNESSASDPLAIKIDATPPSVLSVTGPADKTYGFGDTLDFVVNFSEPVTVTTGPAPAAAKPSIGVKIGGATIQAAYLSGSGSASLTFRTPAIAAGQLDADGVEVTGAFTVPTGAGIRDSAATSVPSTFTGQTFTNVLVDGGPKATLAFNKATRTLTITFDRDVTGVGVEDFVVSVASSTVNLVNLTFTNPLLQTQLGTVTVGGSGKTWTVTASKLPSLKATYTLKLVAMDSGIEDANGGLLMADASVSQSLP